MSTQDKPYAHADWVCPNRQCNPSRSFDVPVYLHGYGDSKIVTCPRCGIKQKLTFKKEGVTYETL